MSTHSSPKSANGQQQPTRLEKIDRMFANGRCTAWTIRITLGLTAIFALIFYSTGSLLNVNRLQKDRSARRPVTFVEPKAPLKPPVAKEQPPKPSRRNAEMKLSRRAALNGDERTEQLLFRKWRIQGRINTR